MLKSRRTGVKAEDVSRFSMRAIWVQFTNINLTIFSFRISFAIIIIIIYKNWGGFEQETKDKKAPDVRRYPLCQDHQTGQQTTAKTRKHAETWPSIILCVVAAKTFVKQTNIGRDLPQQRSRRPRDDDVFLHRQLLSKAAPGCLNWLGPCLHYKQRRLTMGN